MKNKSKSDNDKSKLFESLIKDHCANYSGKEKCVFGNDCTQIGKEAIECNYFAKAVLPIIDALHKKKGGRVV